MSESTVSPPNAYMRQFAGQDCKRAVGLVSVIDVDARTVEIAWASEIVGDRGFLFEVLDCQPQSVRLGRLADGGAVLFNHDQNVLLGVVESVRMDPDRVGRAKVRFDTSEEADKRFQQVVNKVLRHVSVQYRIHDAISEGKRDGVDVFRVVDWEPYELSFVTIPFDHGVGVGRTAGPAEQPIPIPTLPAQPKETRAMDTPQTTTQQPAAPSADALDIKRRDAIIELGVRYADYLSLADVQKACREGTSVHDMQELVMQKLATKHTDTRGAHIGMNKREIAQYSIARAVRAMVTGDWGDAGLEREASAAAAKRFGTGTSGLLLPMDMLASRDFTAGTSNEAGSLISSELRPDLFADVLRNRLAMGRLGVTMLFGLSSNVDIPRKLTASSLGYLTEIAASAETNPTTGKVSLTPKRIGGYVEFSKQAVIQSALAVEPLLRQDIYAAYQDQFENAAINGSGAGANPRGIRSTSGIGAVVGGTNGAQLNWGHIVGLESACANVNSEPDAGSGYLVNTRTRGWAKQTLKAAALPFIWDNGGTPLNGYMAQVTNTVPNTLVKGSSGAVCSSVIFSSNWNMLVMATFGAVEILYDDKILATTGMNRLTLNAFVDIGCRRAADFASMEDALTA